VEIQVENESQWNTDDLKVLVAKVVEINIRNDSDGLCTKLLLFKTSRQKVYRRDKDAPITAAHRGWSRNLSGVRSVDICSKDRLIEKNTLERLAAVSLTDARQDIAPRYIRHIARAIKAALTDDYSPKDDADQFKWAESCQLRALSKITRSPTILQKKIEVLLGERSRLEAVLRREIATVDEKIAALKEKVSRLAAE